MLSGSLYARDAAEEIRQGRLLLTPRTPISPAEPAQHRKKIRKMKAQLLKASDVDRFGDARQELIVLERELAGLRGLVLASGRTEYEGERYRVSVIKKEVERVNAAKLRAFILSSSITHILFGWLLKTEPQVEVRTTVLKS